MVFKPYERRDEWWIWKQINEKRKNKRTLYYGFLQNFEISKLIFIWNIFFIVISNAKSHSMMLSEVKPLLNGLLRIIKKKTTIASFSSLRLT